MSKRSTTGLDRAGCLRLLTTQSSGRLIFARQAVPDELSVSYRLDGENVLIRVPGVADQTPGPQDCGVAFEVDQPETASGDGWTITITGRAREHGSGQLLG